MRAATPEEIELHAEAGRAAVRAHAPYSRFAVGAALRVAGSDRPVLGVNVENASYGLTSCAERNALFTAVAAGHTELRTIAVHADAESAPPCGACRQVLAELARGSPCRLPPVGELVAAPLAELLPGRSRCERAPPVGLAALAGRPNVGKSTLVNRMVGEHVVAVSGRPQTTRRRVLGAVDRDDAQLVLVDLPGFQKPFDRLTERMQRAVDETLADADVAVLVLDASDAVGRRRPVRRRARAAPGRRAGHHRR